MNKNKLIDELTTLLAISLRHKIGSIVNDNELYAQKYAKDAEVLLNEAKKVRGNCNFNIYDKTKIRDEVEKKLRAELESKNFLKEKKFKIIDREINSILKEFGIAD